MIIYSPRPGRAIPAGLPRPYNHTRSPSPWRLRIMSFKLDRVHVWAGEVADQAGGVAAKLSMLAQAGANLEYIYPRRLEGRSGTGILYVAPVTGPLTTRAARAAGLHEVDAPIVLRV